MADEGVLEKNCDGTARGCREMKSTAYTLQLLNCTFFTRIGDRFRFLHQSYFEYWSAEALCKALWRGDLTVVGYLSLHGYLRDKLPPVDCG